MCIIIFFTYIYFAHGFNAYFACIFFLQMTLKKILRVFNFAKSTEIRQIRENMYMRKVVRLRFMLPQKNKEQKKFVFSCVTKYSWS